MRILDRYLIKEFLLPFFHCSAAFLILFFVVDMFENMDSFIQSKIGIMGCLKYYGYFIPIIYSKMMPFALMLSIIFELGTLGKNNEISGMRAAGISRIRISTPLIFTSLFICFCILILDQMIVPKLQIRYDAFVEEKIEKTDENFFRNLENINYFNEKENHILRIDKLLNKGHYIQGVQAHELDNEGNIERIIRADSGQWIDNHWWFFNGTIDYHNKKGVAGKIDFFTKKEMPYTETPQHLILEKRLISQMNYFEMKKSMLKQYGKNPPANKKVDLLSKLASPFTSFVFCLLVIPFGIRVTKGGMLNALLKSVSLCLLFYALTAIFNIIGKQGFIPPMLAVWCAHVIFILIGSLFLAQKT